MDLSSRVALITGAKRVGASVAKLLASRGADIALTYNRSQAEADEIAGAVRALGRRALVVKTNVSDEASCAALVAEVDRAFGRLDVLVNMASVYVSTPFDALTAKEWDASMSVDLRGTFLCSRHAAPIMRRHGGGRIVNFADWLPSSDRPRYKGYLTYYVAKAGVKALTEALALELAGDQILVNAIAPGPVLAPDDLTAEQKKAVEDATPLGRWGGADEVARTVLMLVDTEFITGETIRLDGGRHLH